MKVHQYVMMSAPTAAQYAALEALRERRGGRARHGRRVRPPPPAGVYQRLPAMGLPDRRAARRLLHLPRHPLDRPLGPRVLRALLPEERVAVIPGSAFGESGRGFVRICYAAAYDDIEEAMSRISRFVDRRRAELGDTAGEQ